MKRFSVTSISPSLSKLGSLLFIFLFLCGVGYHTTEMAELHQAQARGIPEQAGIIQASLALSGSQLAMPRVAEVVTELRHSESFLPLPILLPNNVDVERPSAIILSLRNNVSIIPQPCRPYGLSRTRHQFCPEGFAVNRRTGCFLFRRNVLVPQFAIHLPSGA